MRTLVESLKRLYEAGKVTDEKLSQMVTDSKITSEEKTYIESGGSPTPDPDKDGVFPYVYGMGVKVGMKEKYNGVVYVAIQAMTKQINPPSELPAIFQEVTVNG